MKKVIMIFFLFASILMYSETKKENLAVKHWQGILKVSGVELRIVFNIENDTEGKLIGTLDSPDQGAYGIPVSKVNIEKGVWRLEVNAVGGLYEGKEKDGKIEGTWTQNNNSLPLILEKIDEIKKPKRPQVPQKPYPYIEREVEYENEKAGIKLAGTLTLPKEGGPFPAVLLITGSGSQDRNETIFDHKPFLIIADHLTRKGIAVLRVDDRGVGGSTGSPATATTLDFVDDVLSGVKFLKTVKEVNSKKIGLIGHSEGGMIAPIAAVRSKDVKFIVLMAGTGLTGEKILYLQSKLIAKAAGIDKKMIKKNIKQQKETYTLIKNIKDDKILKEKLHTLLKGYYDELTDKEKKQVGDLDKKIKQQIKQVTSPWFKFFLVYDPIPTLKKVRCPVLAINGSLDLQVPPKENLRSIKKALKKSGNKNYKIVEFEGLNHLFQHAKTGAVTEYGKIEETISPEVLEVMADWITKYLM